MKKIIKNYPMLFISIGTIIGAIILYNTTAYRDIAELKEKAPSFIEERGFEVTSYDGYEGSIYHGGFTWYQVRDTSGYLYNLCVGDWRGELMIYNQECLNAVSNEK